MNNDIKLDYVTEIPKTKHGDGIDWKQIFEKIPKNKALVIPKSFACLQSVRTAVIGYNKEAGKLVFALASRNTGKDNECTYVFRVGDF